MMKNECSFEECDRAASSRGLCHAHYLQQYAGKPLTVLRTRTTLPKDGRGRVCSECLEYKTYDHFYKRSNGVTPQSKCKPCYIKKQGVINKRHAA